MRRSCGLLDTQDAPAREEALMFEIVGSSVTRGIGLLSLLFVFAAGASSPACSDDSGGTGNQNETPDAQVTPV